MGDDANTTALEAIAKVMSPTLAALEKLEHVSRYLHPPALGTLVQAVAGADEPVREGLKQFSDSNIPDELQGFQSRIEVVGERICKIFEGLEACTGDDPNEVLSAFQTLRNYPRAIETLYPMASTLPAVSRFFLEPAMKEDRELVEKLALADPSRDDAGVLPVGNARDERGGFSLYIPEYYDGAVALPLIMALHGGSGHGADFLWSWVRTARSFGALLVSPTAIGRTWSLVGQDVDNENLDKIVDYVRERWRVNTAKMLLTGMSDGGTYTYLSGLRSESPFTHLAPCSASFHPMLLAGFESERLKDLPIYLIHGVLDWMFSVRMARDANLGLSKAGATVLYREIKDLSHTYPRDENARVMEWFLSG